MLSEFGHERSLIRNLNMISGDECTAAVIMINARVYVSDVMLGGVPEFLSYSKKIEKLLLTFEKFL